MHPPSNTARFTDSVGASTSQGPRNSQRTYSVQRISFHATYLSAQCTSFRATKTFPCDGYLPHDGSNASDTPKPTYTAKSKQKPDAHTRLTDNLARACTRACLQAEESPQLDEQQKASTAKGIPDIHGTSTSTIHSFGRGSRLYFPLFSFLTFADILVRYVLFQLTRPLAQPAEWACWNLQRPAPLYARTLT